LLPIIDGGFRSMWRHGDGLRRAAFSIDGKTVYTAGGQRLCLWDPASGNLLSEYRSEDVKANIEDCQQSLDGRFLIATQRATLGLVCSASTCEFAGTTKQPITSVAFSDDGLRFVAMTSERTSAVWNAVATAKEVAPFMELSEHSDATCCAIRGDGMLIATGSSGKTARVWDAETCEPVSPPLQHTDRVIFVGFHEHGNQLVTVSADAVIRLWTLDDGSSNERLTHLAKATSGIEIDENGAPVTLTRDRIESEWNAAARDTRGPSR
jgi:WD40 repeat protein